MTLLLTPEQIIKQTGLRLPQGSTVGDLMIRSTVEDALKLGVDAQARHMAKEICKDLVDHGFALSAMRIAVLLKQEGIGL